MGGASRFGAVGSPGGRREASATTSSAPRLPKGAEAAIWSILEPLPDPRNHLALTRDLSGEVHITDLDRALARAEAIETPDLVVDLRQVVDVRQVVDSYYDLGVLEENAGLTEQCFNGVDVASHGGDRITSSTPT